MKSRRIEGNLKRHTKLGGCVYLFCLAVGQTLLGQGAAPKNIWDQSYAVSPSLSWIATTQNQTNYGGSALASVVGSREYCDGKTQQIGILGTASNSDTSTPGSASTLIASDDVHADYMRGIGRNSDAGHGNIGVTQNYLSGFADVFVNNSLGIGLQQQYAGNYERYLRGCRSVEPKKNQATQFFPSVTVGLGFMDQRLYKTTAHMESVIVPVAAQFTLIKRKPNKPPLWFASVQAGYTPTPNDMHAYQASANGTFTVLTPFKNLTLSVGELDVYMNNAPTGFKRNYQSGNVQLNFAWSHTSNPNINPSSPEFPGACYTADTLNHLYCYDQVQQSECSAPSVFRLGARCSEAR